MQIIQTSEELLGKIEDLWEPGRMARSGCGQPAYLTSPEQARRIAAEGLHEQGHTEDEILRDFEIFRERLSEMSVLDCL